MERVLYYRKLINKDSHLPFSLREPLDIPKDVCSLCVYQMGKIHLQLGLHVDYGKD